MARCLVDVPVVGAYHGLLLILHKLLRVFSPVPQSWRERPEIKAVNIAVTFMLVVFGFTLFRAPDLTTAKDIMVQIFTNFHLEIAPQFLSAYMMIVVLAVAGYIAHMLPKAWTTGTLNTYVSMSVVWQALLLAAVLFVVVQTRQSELVPFIYLQY